MLGTSANPLFRKLWTQSLGLRICKPISYRKHLWICGKNLNLRQICKSTTSLGSVLQFSKKYVFTIQCIDRFEWMCFQSTTPSHQVPLLWGNYFPENAAILTAKWVGLRSRNFQRLVFVKENLGFLKWQRIALNDFDYMPSTFSK